MSVKFKPKPTNWKEDVAFCCMRQRLRSCSVAFKIYSCVYFVHKTVSCLNFWCKWCSNVKLYFVNCVAALKALKCRWWFCMHWTMVLFHMSSVTRYTCFSCCYASTFCRLSIATKLLLNFWWHLLYSKTCSLSMSLMLLMMMKQHFIRHCNVNEVTTYLLIWLFQVWLCT